MMTTTPERRAQFPISAKEYHDHDTLLMRPNYGNLPKGLLKFHRYDYMQMQLEA
jgi:hypothetical protein